MDVKSGRHVVIGASKGIGNAIARELVAQNQPVRAVARVAASGAFALPEAVEFLELDARDETALVAACDGATHIYHCVNVPYSKWTEVMPRVTDSVLAAAKAASTRLIFVGNVYGYGRFQTTPVTEEHPLDADTKKGRLRNMLEEKLWVAHHARDIELIVPRFPDFYGPGIVNGLMAPIFKAAIGGKTARWPATLDQKHALVYVGDAARAAVRLATDDSSTGQVWHVPGPAPITGGEFLSLAFEAAGSKPKPGVLPGWLLRLAGLFNADAKELLELMYEFEEPMLLDGGRFSAAYPDFKFTAHTDAVENTVRWFRSM